MLRKHIAHEIFISHSNQLYRSESYENNETTEYVTDK